MSALTLSCWIRRVRPQQRVAPVKLHDLARATSAREPARRRAASRPRFLGMARRRTLVTPFLVESRSRPSRSMLPACRSCQLAGRISRLLRCALYMQLRNVTERASCGSGGCHALSHLARKTDAFLKEDADTSIQHPRRRARSTMANSALASSGSSLSLI